MRPFRLFMILVFLTASALTIVYFRVAAVRTAYHVNRLHADQWRLRREIVRQRAEIARMSDPALIRQWVKTSTGVVPPSLGPPGPPEPVDDSEREAAPVDSADHGNVDD
ncbi:MAG: hypothetical protein PHU85_02745 [Phycisphaerae bacterium]|nr:hypothetical protein [Phycisphaerae bacterium]